MSTALIDPRQPTSQRIGADGPAPADGAESGGTETDKWLGALVVPLAALADPTKRSVRAAVLPVKKVEGQVYIVSTEAGFPNQLPGNVFAAWPALSSLAGTRSASAVKKYAVVRREMFKVGGRVRLAQFDACEIVALADDGSMVQVKRLGGPGEQETIAMPGGIAQLIRQLSEPWVTALVVREARRREARPDRPGHAIAALPEVDTDVGMGGGAPEAGVGLLDQQMRVALQVMMRDGERHDRRVDLSNREELWLAVLPWVECYAAGAGTEAVENIMEGRFPEQWPPYRAEWQRHIAARLSAGTMFGLESIVQTAVPVGLIVSVMVGFSSQCQPLAELVYGQSAFDAESVVAQLDQALGFSFGSHAQLLKILTGNPRTLEALSPGGHTRFLRSQRTVRLTPEGGHAPAPAAARPRGAYADVGPGSAGPGAAAGTAAPRARRGALFAGALGADAGAADGGAGDSSGSDDERGNFITPESLQQRQAGGLGGVAMEPPVLPFAWPGPPPGFAPPTYELHGLGEMGPPPALPGTPAPGAPPNPAQLFPGSAVQWVPHASLPHASGASTPSPASAASTAWPPSGASPPGAAGVVGGTSTATPGMAALTGSWQAPDAVTRMAWVQGRETRADVIHLLVRGTGVEGPAGPMLEAALEGDATRVQPLRYGARSSAAAAEAYALEVLTRVWATLDAVATPQERQLMQPMPAVARVGIILRVLERTAPSRPPAHHGGGGGGGGNAAGTSGHGRGQHLTIYQPGADDVRSYAARSAPVNVAAALWLEQSREAAVWGGAYAAAGAITLGPRGAYVDTPAGPVPTPTAAVQLHMSDEESRSQFGLESALPTSTLRALQADLRVRQRAAEVVMDDCLGHGARANSPMLRKHLAALMALRFTKLRPAAEIGNPVKVPAQTMEGSTSSRGTDVSTVLAMNARIMEAAYPEFSWRPLTDFAYQFGSLTSQSNMVMVRDRGERLFTELMLTLQRGADAVRDLEPTVAPRRASSTSRPSPSSSDRRSSGARSREIRRSATSLVIRTSSSSHVARRSTWPTRCRLPPAAAAVARSATSSASRSTTRSAVSFSRHGRRSTAPRASSKGLAASAARALAVRARSTTP